MLAAIGLNHHRTPISIRERFALHKQELKNALTSLKSEGIGELAILSTCNRTEIYCRTKDYTPVTDWLANTGKIPLSRLQSHLFIAPARDAVRHIFRVASGLDSMVIGEANIFGQIKDAVRVAQESNTLGSSLHRLFQASFAVAKEIRSATEIGRHGVSMATIAVQLAENIYENINNASIMFVGTGEMVELCATHFATRRPKNLMFVSRDLARAEKIAQRFGGEFGLMGDIDNNLQRFDIVISCTETTLPIIGAGMVQRALKARKYQPMMMVDLGVPRNVEPEAKNQNDVYLYSVDDLQDMINTNLSHRQVAGQKAELIIEARVNDFIRYLDERKAVQVIKDMQNLTQNVTDVEIQKALRKIENGGETAEVLKNLSHSLRSKFLHPWISYIHQVEGRPFDELLSIYKNVLGQKDKDIN